MKVKTGVQRSAIPASPPPLLLSAICALFRPTPFKFCAPQQEWPSSGRSRHLILLTLALTAILCLPYCSSDDNGGGGPPSKPPDPRCAETPAGDFQDGEGTEESPYLICTYEQLKNISSGLDKHYELGNNIDASLSWQEGTDSCTHYDGSNADAATCAGWIPLGDRSTQFTGSFDGRDYAIHRLYANVPPDSMGNASAGLFGIAGSSPLVPVSIRNVGLTELSITATVAMGSSTANAGGLLGRSDNAAVKISNSYVRGGSVKASSTHSANAGGLLGWNNGTISNSYAMVSVESSTSSGTIGGASAGGLGGG